MSRVVVASRSTPSARRFGRCPRSAMRAGPGQRPVDQDLCHRYDRRELTGGRHSRPHAADNSPGCVEDEKPQQRQSVRAGRAAPSRRPEQEEHDQPAVMGEEISVSLADRQQAQTADVLPQRSCLLTDQPLRCCDRDRAMSAMQSGLRSWMLEGRGYYSASS